MSGKEKWIKVSKNQLKVSHDVIVTAVEEHLQFKGRTWEWLCDPLNENSSEVVFELFEAVKSRLKITDFNAASKGFNTLSWYGDVKFRFLEVCRKHQQDKKSESISAMAITTLDRNVESLNKEFGLNLAL